MSEDNELLIHGGTILPCDGTNTSPGAVLIKDGIISALGDFDELRSVAGSGVNTLDIEGATLMPGLIDTHPHAMHFTTLQVAMVDLRDAENHDDIVARIRARAEVTPEGEWIMCTPVGEPHYFIRRSWRDLEEGRLPDRSILDRASSAHPVMIQAWAPRVPNMVALNSLALQRLGLSWLTPRRVCDVWIDRDDNNELTGILRGSVTNYYTHDPFWLQIQDRLPPLPEELWVLGGRAGMQEMNALGVTAIYEAHVMDPVHVDAYKALREREQMSCRVLTTLEAASQAFNPHYMPTRDELLHTLELARSYTELDDPWLRHNGTTIARSGPCFPGFINLYEPFTSPYGELIYGYPFLPKWVEEEVVDFCVRNDLRLNVLAATGKDHDEFFDSVSRHAVEDIRKRDWICQHAIFVNEHHARQYADLGMHITTSKGFHWGKGDMYGERIGKHVWQDLIPLRRLLDHGITVGCGTDWGPRNVFEQIQLAITCEFAGSGYCNTAADQGINREEALLMWTRDASRVLGWDRIGTIARGNHADLTVVDRNPVQCSLDDLPGTTVLRTLTGGYTVYDSGGLS